MVAINNILIGFFILYSLLNYILYFKYKDRKYLLSLYGSVLLLFSFILFHPYIRELIIYFFFPDIQDYIAYPAEVNPKYMIRVNNYRLLYLLFPFLFCVVGIVFLAKVFADYTGNKSVVKYLFSYFKNRVY